MRKNNWWDHLFNNHHYDFAYAYAEVDPVIEDKTEEEELFKQFFEFRIGRFFRRITRPLDKIINKVKTKVVNTVKDVTGVTKAEGEARKAYEEAAAEQKKQEAAYKRVSSETQATIAKNQAAYDKQKTEGEAQVRTAQEGASSARRGLESAIKTGKANVAYATKQTAATKSRLQSQKVQRDAAAALKAKQAAQKVKSAKAPGVSGTVVKAIGGLAGTGKAGSAKPKTKGVKDKPGKLLIG
jgi:hypothetical protein